MVDMGEGASPKPTSFGRYVVFYALLLYYVAFCSVFTINFVPTFTLRVLHIVWLILIDKRWNVLACILSLAAFVRYVCFKSNKGYSTEFEDDLVDLPFPSSSMASDELPSYPPLSTPSSLLFSPASPFSSFTSLMSYPHSSFTSRRSSLSYSWSSPQSSPFTSRSSSLSSSWSSPQSSPRSALSSSPPSSLLSSPASPPSSFTSPMSSPHSSFTSRSSSSTSSWSSPQSSPRSSFTSTPSYPHSSFTSASSSLSSPWSSSPQSDFSSSSLSLPPPPPPFKMRPWKFNYVRMASNVSLSSEDSGDSDIDTKAEKFIAQFRSRLNFEEYQRLHERANKA